MSKYGVKHYTKTDEFKHKVMYKNAERFFNNLNDHKLKKKTIPLFEKGEYVNTNKENKYKFQCKTCNDIFFDHIDGGHLPRCLKCNPYIQGFSLGEKEIYTYIRELLPDETVLEKDRMLLGNRELDIYIPTKKLAIEFNGLYWHSEVGGNKDKNYHLDKLNRCLEKGINLIQIFEDEWLYKKDIIKSKLRHILKLNVNDRIYARNCIIKDVKFNDFSKFLEENHIQGSLNTSKVNIGLYYKEELVSVMTLGSGRIALGSKGVVDDWELYRYSTNKTVVGGASKLLSYFIKTYKPKTIVSFADRRWSVGNLYDKLGFKLVNIEDPNYFYFKPGEIKRYNRFTYRKDQLNKKLLIFDNNLTEWENMQINGYDRIWDCGDLKYKLTVN